MNLIKGFYFPGVGTGTCWHK